MRADEIKARRQAAGMTPADLASELQISTRTVARWESGDKEPTRAEEIALDVVFSEQVGAKSCPSPSRKSQKR